MTDKEKVLDILMKKFGLSLNTQWEIYGDKYTMSLKTTKTWVSEFTKEERELVSDVLDSYNLSISYARTNDNKIYDLSKLSNPRINTSKYGEIEIISDNATIFKAIKISNNISELISLGDLTDKGAVIYRNGQIEVNGLSLEQCDITKLYTMQCGQYELVWDKERGVI